MMTVADISGARARRPRRHGGDAVDACASTSTTSSAGCCSADSPLLARAFQGSARPRRRAVDEGDDHRVVSAARPPRRCSTRSPRSTATRRGCVSCTGSSRCRPTTPARRGGSSCAPASGRSPGRSSCAWCAPSASTTSSSASNGSQDDERDHAEWILIGEVAAVDGGAELTMHLEYTGELWSRACSAGSSTTRCGAARPRWRELLSRAAHALNRPSPRRSRRSSRPKASLRRVGGEHLAERACGDDRSGAHQHGVGERRRDVLDVVGDDDERGSVGVGGEVVEGVDELLPAGEVEARRRLVEQHDGRFVHQRAGEQHTASLARRQRDQRVVGEPGDAHPVEALAGALVVVRRVAVPPRFEGAVPRRPHGVERRQRRAQLVGEGRRHEPDAPAQHAHVGVARGARRAPRPSPAVGCSYSAAMRSSDVLPHPLGPSSSQRSPGSHRRGRRRRGSSCRRGRSGSR